MLLCTKCYNSSVYLQSPATVTVGYEQAAYSVREGDSVTVCASIMSGVVSRNISVDTFVTSGSALGPGTGKLHALIM